MNEFKLKGVSKEDAEKLKKSIDECNKILPDPLPQWYYKLPRFVQTYIMLLSVMLVVGIVYWSIIFISKLLK